MRTVLIRASESEFLRRQVARRRVTRAIAMRFVAGDTLDDGIAASRALADAGKAVTLDYLGESVTDAAEARAAAAAYREAIDRLRDETLDAGISVKPSHMGLASDRDLSHELLSDLALAARGVCEHVTLDMEDSAVTESTVALVEWLHDAGHEHVGCAVQSYLHRSEHDVRRLSDAGASLRLCKGAYAEPPEVAYQSRTQVDASYARCAQYLLQHGTYPRFATHDHRLVHYVVRAAEELGRAPDQFEFQMLYGIRTPLQDELVAQGYRVRVYVPYGTEWYPYFMRRLAERPANLGFFLRQLVSR